MHGPLITDTPLQRLTHAVVRECLRIGQLQVPQPGDDLNCGITLEDWRQRRFLHRLEGVGHCAAPGGLSLRREAWIGVALQATAFAEPRTSSSSVPRFCPAQSYLRVAVENSTLPVCSGQHLPALKRGAPVAANLVCRSSPALRCHPAPSHNHIPRQATPRDRQVAKPFG